MEAQIIQYIEQILQRDPLPGEVDTWVTFVNNGNMTLEGVQSAIINSAEAANDVYPVIRAYQAVYGRVPDDDGLDYWVNVYRGVQDLDNPDTPTVNEGMVALLEAWVDPVQTPEFAERFGTNPTGLQFVTACYVNVLNREPDQAGLDYWENAFNVIQAQLVAGGMSEADATLETRQIILEQFVNSVEYIERSEFFVETFLDGAGDGTESYAGSLWDRAPFELAAADVAVAEGDFGSKVVTIDVELDEAPTKDVVLNYTTVAGTATAGNDYVPQTGQITIKAGETKASVQITILGDTLAELDETFDVVFSSPLIVGGSVASTVTIHDDESTTRALTPGIDIFEGQNAGGPGREVFLSSDTELGGNDRIDGGDGEDTLFHMINNAEDYVPFNASMTQEWSIADDLLSGGNGLARGYSVVWSGFQTESVEVLAIQNNDEWFHGYGSAWGQDEGPYGDGSFDYGDSSDGAFAMVDVTDMDGLETVVFYQQNGNTGVRDLQASHIDHDGVHVALIDIEGFHGADGSAYYSGEAPNEYAILEEDNPWTCADEGGLPRQIALTVDTIVDFDVEATRGENEINVLLNEVSMANLWFTQNLDNRDGELAEIEQLNLSLPNEVTLPGSEFDGITGEPALINRIWASSTLHTITVTGDDVTELVGGEPDSEYDLMLGIPILATDDWNDSEADVGDPWGLDVGLPGLTTFDASEFNGDLFLALYNAVNMTILGGSGDDDIFINAEDADSGYLGIHADDVGLLQGTTIDGGEGHNVLWLPMSDNHGYDPNIEGERGFDAVGPGNTLVNIDQIVFYGAIGHGSNTYELNVDWLGLEDPARTELLFDGAIGASTVIFDNFDEVINVKFSDIGGFIPGEPPTYAPTLAFVPAGEGDNDTVNITFADDTRSSSFVTITDDENHGDGLVDIKGTANNESDDEFDGDATAEGDFNDGDVDKEVEVLNIHLEDSDCGIADCLHVGIDSMVDLREITVTDDDYLRSVTPAMALFFQWWAEEAHDMKWEQGVQSSEFNNLPNGLTEEQVCEFIEYFGLDPWNQQNGNGVPLPENFAELEAGDTFVLPQSLAIGTVHGDGTDTPSLALFDASESSANIDMWLGSDGYTDEHGAPLYQLDFDPNGAVILTGSGNDRVIDGSGNDQIETGEGCDLILALNGGDDTILAGGGNDLVVGGEGNDTIFGGEGDDMISGDGFGWLLALLVDDESCIDCSPIIAMLDFFGCIENHCFKDEFQARIDQGSTNSDALTDSHGGGAAYNLIDTEGGQGCDATNALWAYFLEQVDGDTSLLNTDLGLTLDLFDLADALRTGEIDLTPYSGSITLEFDCENEAVRDFILQVLDAPLQSLGLIDVPLSEVLANIEQYVDSMVDGGGDDFIDGGAGNDIIHGGSGNDQLFGGEGNDYLYGGDGSDLVDGGAGADMMTGGFYQVQPGTPQVTTLALTGLFGAAYSNSVADDLPDGELDGDTYNVTISFGGTDYLLSATAEVPEPNTPEQILADLAQDVNTGPLGVLGFSALVVNGELVITGPVGGGSFGVTTSATDGPSLEVFTPQVTTLTIANESYDIGDVVTVNLASLGIDNSDSASVSFTVNQQGMTAAAVAAELRAALLAEGTVTEHLLVSGSGNTITLTGLNSRDVFTATTSVADQPNSGMLYTLQQLNEAVLADGDIISITVNIGGAFAETFSMTYSGSVQETYQAFIDDHADDVYDLIDDGDGTNASTTTAVGGDLLFIDEDGNLAIYDANGVPGDNVIFDIEQTGLGGSTMSQTHISSVTDNTDGSSNTVDAASGHDISQNIVLPAGEGKQVAAGPDGTDGSDLFVAQTDGVLANSWYSQENGGEHVVNQLDHICDFWSSQSPEVGPQIADKLAFRDADGNVVSFGPGSGWYSEGHNAANTYEDALQEANARMANGTTKVVALSYDEGVDGNSDTIFDENENFLVVFADTDGDDLADTAVRLLGRDNVLDDFHHQDIVFTV